jgi:SAM-dependent methyltransferase
MNPPDLSRLHALRDRNEAAGIDMMEQKPRFDRLNARHENGTAPQAVSSFNLFQTPEPLSARLVALLAPKPGWRILEPSAGLGRILRALVASGASETVAVEISPDCCAALYAADLPGVTLKQGDFLTMPNLGEFDGVAMNPPFHMRADIRHVQRALSLLKSGGRLAGICMAGPAREKHIRPLCDSWEPLPVETFAKEGTKTAAVLFSITKP